MAVHQELHFAGVDDLFLDPRNPRLGREKTKLNLQQDNILALMRNFTLDEIAVSFLESGFWVQEALLVVKEELYGQERLVVVEGNRRLAALKNLYDAQEGRSDDKKWLGFLADKPAPVGLFEKVPYMVADERSDIDAFLGFRHVTGIKDWPPAEKAEYIAKLIDENDLSYQEVMRTIGSKTPTVRQNYISFRLLLQMEQQEEIDIEAVEKKFSVLFLSLRTEGVKSYLQVDIQADPGDAAEPVPQEALDQLLNFSKWLFGTSTHPAIVRDSRQVDAFGRILESPAAVEYLERTEHPRFETAFQLAGGDAPELTRLLGTAADDIEAALSRIHLYRDDAKVKSAVNRLGADAFQLLSQFEETRDKLLEMYKLR